MKIGLYDVDSHNFPCLPLMKISTYHKSKGDQVEFWHEDNHYDIVYVTKVFTYSNIPTITNADKIVIGGSGVDLINKLPEEIEHSCPDYSLYPEHDFAVGFLTRGCPRVNHTFCITPTKDGCKSHKVCDLSEWYRGQKTIELLDQNLLAAKEHLELLEQLRDTGATVNYNGGLDIRFTNEENLKILQQIKTRTFHFAWDDPKEDLKQKFKDARPYLLKRANENIVYVLVNYWSTHEEDLYRIYTLRDLGYSPYVMIYDKQKYVNSRGRLLKDIEFTDDQIHHFKICQMMQRWCNSRFIFRTVKDFNDYEYYQKYMKKYAQNKM